MNPCADWLPMATIINTAKRSRRDVWLKEYLQRAPVFEIEKVYKERRGWYFTSLTTRRPLGPYPTFEIASAYHHRYERFKPPIMVAEIGDILQIPCGCIVRLDGAVCEFDDIDSRRVTLYHCCNNAGHNWHRSGMAHRYRYVFVNVWIPAEENLVTAAARMQLAAR